jgi:hypothetical protein
MRRDDLEHVHSPNYALIQVNKLVHEEALQAR